MKKFILASLFAATAISANAGTLYLADGITLIEDTNIALDEGNGNFDNTFRFIQWWDDSATMTTTADSISTLTPTNAAGFTLNGIGEVEMAATSANATGVLSCTGCELTFRFGGITVSIVNVQNPVAVTIYQASMGALPTDQELIDFMTNANLISMIPAFVEGPLLDVSDAFLNVYYDSTPDLDFGAVLDGPTFSVDSTEISNATNDTLWLSLDFNQSRFTPANLNDGVYGLSSVDTFFSFDVTGGSAAYNFDTSNTRFQTVGFDIFTDIIGLGLSAVFKGTEATGYGLYASGTSGNLSGFVVSAPSTIAFMGLGLFGLAFAARRRNK